TAARAVTYRNALLRDRARTIARTETIDASSAGQRALWDEARRAGYLGDDARRHWIITPDERLCPACEEMPKLNPDGVPLGEPYQTPDGGEKMGPTLHPRCRCAESLSPGRGAEPAAYQQ